MSRAARSSLVEGLDIAQVCAMQASGLAEWVRRLGEREPSAGPLVQALLRTLGSFVQIGLGYLSLGRAVGTLSGGEALAREDDPPSGFELDRCHLCLR